MSALRNYLYVFITRVSALRNYLYVFITRVCALINMIITVFNRADTWVRPYGRRTMQSHVFPNAMEMVGHDCHFVAYNVGEFFLRFVIPFFHHVTGVVQNHFIVFDFAEQAFAVLHTHGNEIQSFRGVIVTWQANGTAVVDVWIVGGHGLLLLWDKDKKNSVAFLRCILFCIFATVSINMIGI